MGFSEHANSVPPQRCAVTVTGPEVAKSIIEQSHGAGCAFNDGGQRFLPSNRGDPNPFGTKQRQCCPELRIGSGVNIHVLVHCVQMVSSAQPVGSIHFSKAVAHDYSRPRSSVAGDVLPEIVQTQKEDRLFDDQSCVAICCMC
jgi:hypothetical protein